MNTLPFPIPIIAILLFAGCGDMATLPESAGMGPQPILPAPRKSLFPTVKVAKAIGWPEGSAPTPATGFAVNAFATGLDHPRWLYVLPNGDVLVAESNAPPRPEDGRGIKAKLQKLFMKRAGAGTPSANRITLLRDADGDGTAEQRQVLLQGLNSPFGMALVGDSLFVANTDGVMRFTYHEGDTQIAGPGEKFAALPGGKLNHHWTKNLIASADGSKLYATVGSNSNVAENGIEQETNRAAILEIDSTTGSTRLFASGLRNPNGMGWRGNTLFTVVNERDELGSDLVPDYLTSVRDGGFYGWPYSYYGNHVDERVQPPRPDLVASALVPDFALGPHTASLGLVFYDASLLPEKYQGGAFIGQHGSWNRKPFSGYRVLFVPFVNEKPAGISEPVLTGFVDDEGKARGRPVGVAVDRAGALLVADDVGNVIWRLTPRF
ncbi:MAG: sorbosone dehydrogenase family protein [Steroidobacteraceae bacterium]